MCLLCPALQEGHSTGSATETRERSWMSASLLALTLSSCAAGWFLRKPQITTASPAAGDEIRAMQG